MSESKLTAEQRRVVVVLLGQGYGWKAVASRVGGNRRSVRELCHRWRVHGEGALVTKPTKARFSAEIKCEVVERFLAGETKTALVIEYGLSSERLVRKWAAIYREQGPQGLEPAPRGRPARPSEDELDEVGRLRRDNERLRAKVALLEKLRALGASEPDGS